MMARDHTPICHACIREARLTNGSEVYPGHKEAAKRKVYICDGCSARVGVHAGTTKPLGTLADAETAAARTYLHAAIDPLWQNADRAHGIKTSAGVRARQMARDRVYSFLSDRLGIDRRDCHIGEFDLARCRAAGKAMQGITYSQICDYAAARLRKGVG